MRGKIVANKSYKTTSWGRRYADVVICPVRELEFQVRPGRTALDPWHYTVRDLDGNHIGYVNHHADAVGDRRHRSINSREFWDKIDALRG
jgi:hypothetical protein